MDGEDTREQVHADSADRRLGADGDADGDADKDWTPLEDLDDAEFGLPPVDYTPSLEEILGAEDAYYEDVDEDEASLSNHLTATRSEHSDGFSLGLGSCALLDTLSLTSRGSGDSKSRTSSKFSRGRTFRKEKDKRRSIVRHVILKGISSQLASAFERVGAGLASCMAVGHSFIAVGTMHGFILVFDSLQVLKWSLGGTSYGQQFGPVSSLTISADCQRLLVGFAKGQLLEFDLQSGKQVLELPEAHPQGSAVLHIKLTDNPSVVLLCDSGGSVFEVQFKRTMGIRGYSSRCLFSGSRGEVCAVEPLSLAEHPDHWLGHQRHIVAMATISKVIVLALTPAAKVLFTHPLTGRSDTLPVLSWQFVVIQTSKAEKVVDPVLAFARQSTVYFFQLTDSLSGKMVFVPLQKLELSYEILNLGWLNARCMAILDTTEGFHLHDVKNLEELESIDVSDVKIVYGSSFFKGLATGGNVSQAMSVAGERAVYSSFVTLNNQLLMLGRQAFHVLLIRTWSERLDYLVKENRYIECLNLGCEIFQDHGKALVGLKGPKDKRRKLVTQKMLAVLLAFLDVSMTKNFPEQGDIMVLAKYFDSVVPPCVTTCMTIKLRDVLFGKVWETFSLDPFAKAKYLETLESYILSDQLKSIPVEIGKEFVCHFEQIRRFDALEACLTHLHVTSLDIHQVMSLCWLHGLYDPIIYIYNNGMETYVTPLEELLSHLTGAVQKGESLSQRQIDLGNKILVYVSCCLAGRAYPYGDIPRERLAKVKYDIYTTLTALHSRKCADDEPVYPHLRTLLHFDTQGLLNVISIAFEEPEFNTEVGRCQKQRLIDILLQIMVHGSDYSAAQIGHLFTFLARQIARSDNTLSVSRDLFDKVLEVLTNSLENAQREEREQALMDMLNAGGQQYFDRERLIFQAQKVKFYRILEMLYEQGREYDKVLRCYLDDANRQSQAFAFVQKVLADNDHYGGEAKGQVEKSVIANLETLLDIDLKKTATVVYHHMYSYIPLVISKIEKKRRVLFDYLRYSMDLKEAGTPVSSPVHHSSNDVLAAKETFLDYLELMCEFDAKRVATFLKSRTIGFDVDAALTACRKRGIVDAQAVLLERQGRSKEAFALLKQTLEEKLRGCGSVADGERELFWAQVNASVIVIVQLCQRTSEGLAAEEREQLWMQLLDMLLQLPHHHLAKADLDALKGVVMHVVSSTVGYLPLRSVIEKLLSESAYDASSFGDIRQFVCEMLEIYHYEEVLLRATVKLVHSDLHDQTLLRQRAARRGIGVAEPSCDLCTRSLSCSSTREDRAVAFQCSHKFHLSCLEQAGCAVVSALGHESWQCYTCMVAERSDGHRTANSHAKAENSLWDDLQRAELDGADSRNVECAKAYLDEFRSPCNPSLTFDRMQSKDKLHNVVTSAASYVSVFERPEFALKLWSGPK